MVQINSGAMCLYLAIIMSAPLCQFLPHHLLVLIDNDTLAFFGSTQQLPSPH